MAYSKQLAARIRSALRNTTRVEEKPMMGGLTFMVDDKMCLGVVDDDLMARIDPKVYDAALRTKGCREMDFTGKPMRGFVFVSSKGTAGKKNLIYWIDLALDFNSRARSSRKER